MKASLTVPLLSHSTATLPNGIPFDLSTNVDEAGNAQVYLRLPNVAEGGFSDSLLCHYFFLLVLAIVLSLCERHSSTVSRKT